MIFVYVAWWKSSIAFVNKLVISLSKRHVEKKLEQWRTTHTIILTSWNIIDWRGVIIFQNHSQYWYWYVNSIDDTLLSVFYLRNTCNTDSLKIPWQMLIMLILTFLTIYAICFQDDEEPSDPKYAPDGEYIPRILFIGTRIIFLCYFVTCNYLKATWKDTLQHGTIPLVYKI